MLEKEYAVGKVNEEKILDEILALGTAYMWVGKRNECLLHFERASEGFQRVLGEDR